MSDDDIEVDFEPESRSVDLVTLWEVETAQHMVIFPEHPGVVAASFGVDLIRACKKTAAVEGCSADKPWHELGAKPVNMKVVK